MKLKILNRSHCRTYLKESEPLIRSERSSSSVRPAIDFCLVPRIQDLEKVTPLFLLILCKGFFPSATAALEIVNDGPQFITIRRIFDLGSSLHVSMCEDKCQFDTETLNPSQQQARQQQQRRPQRRQQTPQFLDIVDSMRFFPTIHIRRLIMRPLRQHDLRRGGRRMSHGTYVCRILCSLQNSKHFVPIHPQWRDVQAVPKRRCGETHTASRATISSRRWWWRRSAECGTRRCKECPILGTGIVDVRLLSKPSNKCICCFCNCCRPPLQLWSITHAFT